MRLRAPLRTCRRPSVASATIAAVNGALLMSSKSPKGAVPRPKKLHFADVTAGPGRLEPLGPDELEIARLARRTASASDAGPMVADNGGGIRLIVGLRRREVGVDDDATYFRLKMALVRGLRRRFKRAQIEVDEADDKPAAEKSFNVRAEPADAAMLEQANVIVARVLRWRRWDSSAR